MRKSKGGSILRMYSAFVVSLIFICLALSPSSLAEQERVTRLTIFPDDLALVEELREVRVEAGLTEISFGPVPKGLILDSIYVEAKGCENVGGEFITNSFVSWKVRSPTDGLIPLRIAYLTTGLTWQLSYQVGIGEEDGYMDLTAWATVDNKTEIAFPGVYLTLQTENPFFPPKEEELSGQEDISRLAPSSRPLPIIPYPVTLKHGEKKRFVLFSRSRVPMEKVCLFDADKYGQEVREELTFKNSQEQGLGISLPPGPVYIYKFAPGGRMSFLGIANLTEIPPEAQARVYLGQAEDLEGERVQTRYYQWETSEKEYGFRIILRNRGDRLRKVRILEHFYGEWEILNSYPAEYLQMKDAILYEVEVPPQGSYEIEYLARIK